MHYLVPNLSVLWGFIHISNFHEARAHSLSNPEEDRSARRPGARLENDLGQLQILFRIDVDSLFASQNTTERME